MIRPKGAQGFTLTEMVIATAMFTIVGVAVFSYITKNMNFFQKNRSKQQIQMDARACLDTIVQRMSAGKASSLIISTPTETPPVPNSRVDFKLAAPLPNGTTGYAIYLSTGTVYTQEYGSYTPSPHAARGVASNVTGLFFGTDASDPSIVYVTLDMSPPLANADFNSNSSAQSALTFPSETIHMSEAP